MNDFKKPIHPKDPYKDIKISPIEEKKEKEFYSPKEFDKTNVNALKRYFLFLFQKIVSLFKADSEKIYNLKNAINELKTQLEILFENDVSKDSTFIKNLLNAWALFINAYTFTYLRHKKHHELIDLLIDEISNYKADKGYSFGYYLENCQDNKWYPFPFINLLKDLYTENKIKKNSSIFQKSILKKKYLSVKKEKLSLLEKWITILNELTM